MFQQENENGFYCSIFVYALQIIKLTIILAAIFLPTWRFADYADYTRQEGKTEQRKILWLNNENMGHDISTCLFKCLSNV